MDDKTQTEPPKLTHTQALWLFGHGMLKAWLALAVGAAIGYALAVVLARQGGTSVRAIAWELLADKGPIGVIVMYGMGGVLIEALRVQGWSRPEAGLRGRDAALRLRVWLLAILGVAAIGIGLYAGLWWVS